MTTRIILTLLAFHQNDLETLELHLMYGLRAMQEWEGAGFDNSSSIAPTLFAVLVGLNLKNADSVRPGLLPAGR